jgi:hypothetical protein
LDLILWFNKLLHQIGIALRFKVPSDKFLFENTSSFLIKVGESNCFQAYS